jgi:hypothetical protein
MVMVNLLPQLEHEGINYGMPEKNPTAVESAKACLSFSLRVNGQIKGDELLLWNMHKLMQLFISNAEKCCCELLHQNGFGVLVH